ncbi:gamma-glutamylcyclotransferase [Sinorhizobium medicae]|uniref:glutathione-specific gamma-glutamylcyclotransferase n=1 Tax=Sinorhizobium medicae (strain WSM419) TaxID=366394 RepID=A6U8T4_SINMW|nr:gamma-glutamylcyclotransferase [Sinorhizobium medicae]ABR60064.1 ChaC family protein [Sinorhizobium medicae WSM419]MDX0480544.1 gamma-glutamylcyclotransferase [Sinorhizobium medicae]MDX0838017.1 gamma-glutamylcyclotransferase [Sinorhizobium medicae]MDX0851359.1 gamma-glutamylcyclotransferase [Sinorhizobium medicae]MDX0898638.1 gamma-glutamylcyclotransferase [Sinorhizobium medicae]
MRSRVMSLTKDLVERCWRAEIDEGRNPALTPMTALEYAELRKRLILESEPDPLWIFAYGSLIWKPIFVPVEHRRATAHGWHRSFCLELQNWRGTRAQPGLMMALDTGGSCNGLVYRVPEADRTMAIHELVDREIAYREDTLSVRWLRVDTKEGAVRALVFYAAPRGVGVVRRLPLQQVAWTLARACGHAGSGAEYLFHTVSKLEENGIHDRNLWQLQGLVATEIANIYPVAMRKED